MLDNHGKVAIAQLVLYSPAFVFCLWSFIRDGFGRGNGWIYLLTFCAIRIAGAAMIIDIENHPANLTSLLPPATVLNTVALSPLMGSTLSFLRRRSVSQYESENFTVTLRLLRPLHIAIILALGVGIVGAEDITKVDADQSTYNTGVTLLRIANVLFLLIWIALVLATVSFWTGPSKLEPDQRVILIGISTALPFILIRTIYSGLNAINLNTGSSSHHTTKYNPVSGDWALYLTLGLLMEIIVVVVYVTAGTWIWFRYRKNSEAQGGHELSD